MSDAPIAAQLFQAAARHASQQGLTLESGAADRVHGLAAAAAVKIAALPEAEIAGAVRVTEYQLIRVIDHASIRAEPPHAESITPIVVSADSIADTLQSLCPILFICD